jgi:hypothetical protein
MDTVPYPIVRRSFFTGFIELLLKRNKSGIEFHGQFSYDALPYFHFGRPRLPLIFHSTYGQQKRFAQYDPGIRQLLLCPGQHTDIHFPETICRNRIFTGEHTVHIVDADENTEQLRLDVQRIPLSARGQVGELVAADPPVEKVKALRRMITLRDFQ